MGMFTRLCCTPVLEIVHQSINDVAECFRATTGPPRLRDVIAVHSECWEFPGSWSSRVLSHFTSSIRLVKVSCQGNLVDGNSPQLPFFVTNWDRSPRGVHVLPHFTTKQIQLRLPFAFHVDILFNNFLKIKFCCSIRHHRLKQTSKSFFLYD